MWTMTVLAAPPVKRAASSAPIRFARDIQPILSDKCFKCHGPDSKSRKANLRLDTPEGIAQMFVAGKPLASKALLRMTHKVPALRMPPPDSNLDLTPAQMALIKRWVAEGAKWEKHWAFVPPQRPPIPVIQGRGKREEGREHTALRTQNSELRTQNPIDAFIRARLEKAGLKPSPPASRTTLIRRVTLDLTGLPPTPQEVNAFLRDKSPNAYEKVVDRLLASPRFGERMVWEWLDAARYSDTNGFQEDRARPMWFWRDWAINALNANMPFDQFTLEQIAGDLLPNATQSQKIATGFNRNHMLNGEGGRIPEESRVEYVMDRVETTGTLWLGLTIGCARCHDHKYDPLTMRDYYSFSAYFNSIAETGAVDRDGSANPVLPVPTEEQAKRLAAAQQKVNELRQKRDALDKMSEAYKTAQKEVESAEKELAEANRAIPVAMVMQDLEKPRDTFILLRGAYDKPGEKVTHGVPAVLNSLPKDAPANRLALARWLVSPKNPLTARVAVNRLWQTFFGIGLVKTAEDFGIQGERPSHPELLDWLAVEFMEGGKRQERGKREEGREPSALSTQNSELRTQHSVWDVKRMIRLIVTSGAYRQSSRVTPELLQKDPENRLLARGPRYRLPSFMLRDQALVLSGLLVEQLGGPPVKPYQPEGVWEDFSYGKITYQQDHGDALYRRSLYTFWRRSVAPTTLFDTATRRVCQVRVERTNTPLQALTLFNDITYVEAARKFAERAMKEGGATPEARLGWMFQLATARNPKPAELAVLTRSFRRNLTHYQRDKEAATKLLTVGESKADAALDPAELAASAAVAGLILNLDEVLSKE